MFTTSGKELSTCFNQQSSRCIASLYDTCQALCNRKWSNEHLFCLLGNCNHAIDLILRGQQSIFRRRQAGQCVLNLQAGLMSRTINKLDHLEQQMLSKVPQGNSLATERLVQSHQIIDLAAFRRMDNGMMAKG
mmetsp:Transcript_33961/g.76343  ORF Transcript_33961/g.76343 Transcript_33961/m.76343 type:complete len:133 (+) Transcript_33961:1212-1610(+)